MQGVLHHPDGRVTELCVWCGQDTGVDAACHVDLRVGYVDGVGQTCPLGCSNPEPTRQPPTTQITTSMLKILTLTTQTLVQLGAREAARDRFAAAIEDMEKTR